MDNEQAAKLVFREVLGSGNLLEAGSGVKASDALVQVVQHLKWTPSKIAPGAVPHETSCMAEMLQNGGDKDLNCL